ncbi:protocadherin Fat 4-like [Anneissia japonica]|uniref:protocadherin Fat 4-like n=1 Tax=Anneissia japonica TaxID=1529436 RepID=UPI001425A37C|nr:protocadherin Fat 4-like [Anneissia japonica]
MGRENCLCKLSTATMRNLWTSSPHWRPIFLVFYLLFTLASTQTDPRAAEYETFTVFEGLPAQTVIGTIATKTGFTYSLSEESPYFDIDGDSGTLRTRTVIDRDILPSDVFNLVVLSSAPTYPIEVQITVLDINDNAPVFPQPVLDIPFSESASIGTQVILDTAVDNDEKQNDVTADYAVVSSNAVGVFSLIITTNPDGDMTFLHLELISALDRETQDSYQLNISAQDGGTPIKYGYMLLNITVTDANDNEPIFETSAYDVSLNESVLVGTTVIQVRATDADIGSNAAITYSLKESSDSFDTRYFTIDPQTGVISVLEEVNYDVSSSYTLTVEASDNGHPRLVGRAYVSIRLVDQNNHAPTVNFSPPALENSITIEEGVPIEKTITVATVSDKDTGLNGLTTLNIFSGNDLHHFKLKIFRLNQDGSLYLLKINGSIDRERHPRYNITFQASDLGSPPRLSFANLIINVNDQNDHSPEFQKPFYAANLSELVPIGSFVQSVTATDEDSGANADIMYEIIGGNELDWFEIDENSGLVLTKKTIDRETTSAVTLNISASDQGIVVFTTSTLLNITILDENDEVPSFTETIYNASVPENSMSGYQLITVSASDNDEGDKGVVTYSFSQETVRRFPGVFNIDSNFGLISTATILDRETINRYELEVIAQDSGSPSLMSMAIVNVDVLDENDNNPVFYPENYFADILENKPSGTFVVQVIASDADSGESERIQYSITQDDSQGKFQIDSETGWVTTTVALDRELRSSYILTVTATDEGNREAVAPAIVQISVIDERDSPPIFSQNDYQFVIFENVPVASSIGTVHASTPDLNTDITYTIFSGDPNGVFQINEVSGQINVVRDVDREAQSFYQLTVFASGGSMIGRTVVNVTILDLNDNSPLFPRLTDSANVVENWEIGHEVYHAQAVDADSGPNAKIAYELVRNPDMTFAIDPNSGIVTLRKTLQNSESTDFFIQILAIDFGTPHQSSILNVSISIRDVNNHAPVFLSSHFGHSISEAIPVNTRFISVSATDGDEGENGEITYVISDGNIDDKFGIFPDGNVYVKSYLDREQTERYTLTIYAFDGGVPQRSSETTLTVQILDENDNRPLFENNTYVFYLEENLPPGFVLGQVRSKDRDIGLNAEITYSFVNNQTEFAIDPITGLITSKVMFDRESFYKRTRSNQIMFDIISTDSGELPLQDQTSVTVNVVDINDNTPEFSRQIYEVSISELAPNNTSVVQVSAKDADCGDNSYLTYTIVSGNEQRRFSINHVSGQIILSGNLDREFTDNYSLLVAAHDAGTPPKSATATVDISVLDGNDNIPVFVSSNVEIEVVESFPVGKELTSVTANDIDIDLNGVISYQITSGNVQNVFTIEPNTGSLFLTKSLDFETQSIYKLNITASDGGTSPNMNTITLVIYVRDYNDNPPAFPSNSVVLSVSENTEINTELVAVTAMDPDSDINGELQYSIVGQIPEGRKFGIHPFSGILYIAGEIDREDLLDYNGLFHLTVQATDQAQPESNRRMATKNVTIIVTDKNDNNPVFVSQSAAVISETASVGATVTTVSAIDKDEGINGEVTYKLNANDFFDVNPQSGVITLIRSINLSTPKYALLVTAKDNGTEQRQTHSALTVIIGDNENSGPSFTSNSYSASIAENAVNDTAVLTVSAMYADARSANIQYFITAVSTGSSSRERDFVISSTNGIIRTSAPLDHENGNDVYTMTVYAVDVDASTPRTRNTQVRITVTDINDNAPVFEKDSYRVTIPENASPGSLLTSVSATDIDSSGSISYRIINADPALFQIVSTSGELRTAAILDRETEQLYRFSVEASDGTLTSRASVEIEVNDFNDNDPIFSEPVYSFSVSEDEVINSEVAIVTATDADDGSNAELEYSIVEDGGFGEDVFQINSETGVISLTEKLDYETRAYYALTVQASDKGSPSRLSTATVYFNVLDVNDHSPIFNPDHYEQWVLENTSIGTQILQVIAEDADSGNNAIFKYTITSGNSGNLFTINDDGIIYTNKVLDRESKAFYNLAVTATDQPSDPSMARSSTAQVSILLSDINDNAPQFTNPGIISVPEDTSIGTIIMVIHATDPDATENSYISYSMSPVPGDVFRLDADGNLQVWGQLDRETRAEYTLTVIASDKGQPVQSSSMNIAVEITDSNDNPPVFLVDSPHVTLSESLPVGVEFLQVSATDADEGENSDLIFTIISGNTNDDFAIDSSRGVLFSKNPLDRERTSSYTITVQAKDSSRSPLYAITNVNIDISDVNDYRPVFLDSPYTINVQENAQSLPVIINRISATDLDANSNSQLTYSLTGNEDGDLFTIDPSTGFISIHQALDREVVEQYTLTVTARDAGSPSLTGTGTISIIVRDENDNSPVFDPDTFNITIDEEVPIGTDVLLVSATDADVGDNGNIRYQLNDEIGTMFTINPVSGQIITAGRLDREVLSTYNLVVTATDGNALSPANSRTATANVVVYLRDINDNGPVFPIVSLAATIPSTCGAGTYVTAIGGTDADEPSNSDIVYSITTGDTSKFQVGTSSGIITTKKQLTSESVSYVLEVTGSDLESAFPVAMATVTITFSSSQFPVFSAVETSYDIEESRTVGSHLVTVQAVSQNARTTYALSGGNIDEAFNIDRNGQIRIAKSLDRELTPDYELWVEARSESSPALSSFLMLDVTITDVNDNAPVFTKILYYGDVMENYAAPVPVVVVTANDADLAGNGQFEYEIDSAGNHQNAFYINPQTGEISTTKSLDREEYASYTLTVYAIDEGSPIMTGTSMVEVTIQDQNDNGIRFDSIYSANLPENSAFGSYVITVTATDHDGSTNSVITYSIKDDGDHNLFDIDPTSGRITVVGNLDYESQSIHRLTVEARDTSHLIETTVTINVLDVNDNAPVFTLVTYEKWIQEGLRVNTPVFEVTAVDVDEGDGGEVRYRMKTMSDYFKIDSVTGVISIKNEILFVTQDSTITDPNVYSVSVVAYDRGIPLFSNDTVILFHVQDSNDHPPVFEEESYFSPAPENIRIGQSIIQVVAKDELDIGINAEILYSVSGGNGSATFVVNPTSGWISPKASLEGFIGRYFQLLVKAQDQGQQDQMEATATVIILVTSINVNTPTFSGTPYQVIIPEDQLVPSQIFIASASDEDAGMNGEILYSITTGNELGLFNINPSTGAVSVIKPLDYESKNVHYLYITAVDQAWDSKQSTVVFTVQLTNINDNSPVFNPTSYTAMIAENSPSATTVVTVSATDADTPPNAGFYYSIIGGSGRDYFIVNSETGIILTQGNLDYESSNQDFELTVAATDVDPQVFRQGIAHVVIHVTGVNEYFPRFIQNSYDFFVREDAVDGFVVDRVIATDTDQGADGEVFYYLVGANTDKGFSINEITGEIFVSKAHGTLDRETENKVVLTVLAKNAGPIDGDNVDKATVTMFITDANDPPIFLEENYFGSVSEGAAVETSILTVTAVEYDELPSDRRFNYSITAGNINNAFKVDSFGAVKVNNNLDRETIDEYTLTVSATDEGNPPQSGFTTVVISLTDVNDNGPILETSAGSVLENRPIGSNVMTLIASDPDIAPQEPFSFSIYSGGSKFDLDRSSGLLTTNAVFDRESQSEYFLSIEISDSGSPQMTSISTLRIKIEDENDNPSSSRTARIEVKSYESNFPGGLIAEVKPNDVDTDDTFNCRLISSDTSMFSILRGCELHSTSHSGENQYQLTVSGNDGTHAEVQSSFSVEFQQFGSAALTSSLTLRLSNTNAEYFVMNSYNQFLTSVSSLLNSGESIIVFSLKDVSDNNQLDLLVAIEKSNGQYIPRSQASAFFQSNINTIESQSNVDIEMINFTPCQLNPCQNQGTCSDYVEMYDDEIIVETSEIIIVARNTSRVFECACAIEFHGTLCELEVDQCESVVCQNGGTCVDGSGSFSCQCLSGFSGDLCEINNDDCNGNLCTNGGTCIDLVNTHRCECPTGYFGVYCEEGPCTSQPCQNGGTCRERGGTYQCECKYGEKGNDCQFSSIGFEGGSYMEFISTLGSSNIITIEFTTVQANALLFYNHDGTTTYLSNFLALEVINGQLQLSYSDGGDIIRIKTMKVVSDGQWHTVQAKQDNQGCDLVLFDTDCPPSPDNAKMCRVSKTANLIRGLNLQGVPVSVGGVMSVRNVTDRFWQVSTADYVGCIRDIYVNSQQLGDSNVFRSAGTIDGCPRDLTTCSGQVCAGQSVCVDEWWTYRCECEEEKAGLTCDEVALPVSFGSGAYVEYTVKESYRRQQQLDNAKSNNNRKRRATNKQSLNMRFRTQADDGLLLLVNTGEEFTLLQVVDGALTYSYGTSYSTVGTITIASPKCNTGSWHNASIVRDDRHITLSLDDASKSSIFDKTPPDFSGVDVTLMSLGGTKDDLVVDGTTIAGLEGCVDSFSLNGEQLPFDGGNEAFEATVSTNTAKGCSVVDLCSSNPCLGTELCVDQETYYECRPLVAPKDSNSSLVIILVLVFIILAGIIAALLFIIIRKRKMEKKACIQNGAAVFPSSEDNLDQQPGHYNMAFDDPSLVKGQPEIMLCQPDILENESNRYKYPNISPICHNTIMDTDDVTIGIEDSIDEQIVPEHYDIENASSIAPSDVEATYYYRNYHDIEKRHRKHNYGKRSPNPLLARMQRESPVSHISRHSPNPLLRASPNMYTDITQKTSARQSPAGFKPNIRASPLHGSQSASPTKDLMQQRANSQYSLTSEQQSIYSAPVVRTSSLAVNELSLKSQSQTKLRNPNGVPNGMPVGLTVDEVKRLNTARPDLMMGSHASTMDNLSSLSSDDETGVKSSVLIDSTRLLEPPDSTSDESNDSFTCSEFESETEHTMSRSELEPGTLIFSRLAEVENETDEVDQDATIPYNYEGFNSIGGSLSTLFMSEDELPHLKQNGLFNWDEFLNWGPAFEKLVGVFKDISQLQDSSDSESCVKISYSINNTIEEEYV